MARAKKEDKSEATDSVYKKGDASNSGEGRGWDRLEEGDAERILIGWVVEPKHMS